ncbi:hypothetical protein GCM10009715_21470 [Paeniglutamicibacter psychrophenolicus]|uniref:DUF2191 domain-containing protein n=1 Tax=Paeniglutamicibacter psychrophenolicus TaxID=257454 RepID=A0ABS4WHA6_9MICC|nr:type II toxin-antitoxin system VapB family antitoxin [Paeniglutamicibacter psychrophenolicus]MBP2375583.1 hypothetical protein [Paeniglutamicibacter psychrophenolicus]
MAVAKVDVDLKLLERARALTGGKSDRVVLDLALRRLIASKQKGSMIGGISDLRALASELGSPVVVPPRTP